MPTKPALCVLHIKCCNCIIPALTVGPILYFYRMEVKEAATDYGKQKISIEDYLEMENVSLEKHEYYEGEVFAVAGAKAPHNKILKNLFGTLLEN